MAPANGTLHFEKVAIRWDIKLNDLGNQLKIF
jgi:hypothetical protein